MIYIGDGIYGGYFAAMAKGKTDLLNVSIIGFYYSIGKETI